jgi:hypothetical protein
MAVDQIMFGVDGIGFIAGIDQSLENLIAVFFFVPGNPDDGKNFLFFQDISDIRHEGILSLFFCL